MEKLSKRKPIIVIDKLETLKVLTDPLRIQILELLDPKPSTVNEVAIKLGFSSSRLYYHFKLLEDHGLIEVVDTRMINNMVEKLYWVTAEDFDIDKDLLNFSSETGRENVVQYITATLGATREDILRSINARKITLEKGGKPNPRNMVMMFTKRRIKDQTYVEFIDRFNALIKEFNELPEETGEGEDINVFSVVCYLYPSYYYDEEEDLNEGQSSKTKS